MYRFSHRLVFDIVKCSSFCKFNKRNEKLIHCLNRCNTCAQQFWMFVRNKSSSQSYIFGDDLLKGELEHFITSDNKITSYNDRCVAKISKFFNVEIKSAKEVINLYPQFFLEESNKSFKRCKELTKHFPLDIIFKNLWLLEYSSSYLDYCVEEMNSWDVLEDERNKMLKLIQLPKSYFDLFSRRCQREKTIIPHKNFIFYLSSKMECSIEEVVDILIKNRILLIRSYKLVDTMMKLLLDNGVPASYIKSDSWILNYSRKKIEPKINMLKREGITDIKPWMMRCVDSSLSSLIELNEKEISVLSPGQSKEDYLCSRLNIDKDYIKRISERIPILMNTSASKLKEMLDFLYSEGFTNTDILLTPRVIGHNIYTLKERISELRNLGYTPSLSKICRSEETYRKFVAQLYHNITNGGVNLQNTIDNYKYEHKCT